MKRRASENNFDDDIPVRNAGMVIRAVVFDIGGESDIKVIEADFTRHDIFVADECLLTGTAAEIVPVVKADGRIIGNGKPGAITTRIIARFREMIHQTGTPIFD